MEISNSFVEHHKYLETLKVSAIVYVVYELALFVLLTIFYGIESYRVEGHDGGFVFGVYPWNVFISLSLGLPLVFAAGMYLIKKCLDIITGSKIITDPKQDKENTTYLQGILSRMGQYNIFVFGVAIFILWRGIDWLSGDKFNLEQLLSLKKLIWPVVIAVIVVALIKYGCLFLAARLNANHQIKMMQLQVDEQAIVRGLIPAGYQLINASELRALPQTQDSTPLLQENNQKS